MFRVGFGAATVSCVCQVGYFASDSLVRVRCAALRARIMEFCLRRLMVAAVVFWLLSTGLSDSDVRMDVDGRMAHDYPSPRCCVAADCIKRHQSYGRHAVVSTPLLRSSEYLTLLRDLQCSLQYTNPSLTFIVLAVANELSAIEVAEVEGFAEYWEVPNIEYENHYSSHFSKNWFKLHAWNITEYSSIILLDADTVVMQDLNHMFFLPTDFAWSCLNAPHYNYNRGGFVMLRPCRRVFEHMLGILDEDVSKRFADSFFEHSFFDWYFGFTGLRLPMIYNANFEHLDDQGLTAGGAAPVVVHFADVKPFNIVEGDRGWQFMCHRYRQQHKQCSQHLIPLQGKAG